MAVTAPVTQFFAHDESKGREKPKAEKKPKAGGGRTPKGHDDVIRVNSILASGVSDMCLCVFVDSGSGGTKCVGIDRDGGGASWRQSRVLD